MKTLFLECKMGAAGDMLTAGLLDLFEDKEEKVKELNALGLPGVEFVLKKAVKGGIEGSQMLVKVHGEEEVSNDIHDHDHHHHDHDHMHGHEHHHHDHDHVHPHIHRGMEEIRTIIGQLTMKDKVKKDVLAVYEEIALAESLSHGVPVSEIHFHEVGAMDAIADISAVSYLIDRLKVDKIVSSPIHVGSGHVHCAHGILPVPAPATAHILKGLPIYGGKIQGELCTPTGAALLKYFVEDFGDMPMMKVEKIGYGMGKKDFAWANCIRLFLGQTEDLSETVYELSCNIDDMTGEELSFAMDRLFEAGALEVYTIPIGMKKTRPGHLIRVMCQEKQRAHLVETIFQHTSTIGIREVPTKRYILSREIEEIPTSLGILHRKKSYGYGVERKKYEYEDLAKVAKEKKISLEAVRKSLEEEEKKETSF